jgi:hypothetical protein
VEDNELHFGCVDVEVPVEHPSGNVKQRRENDGE